MAEMEPTVTILLPEAARALTRAVPESVVPVSGAQTRSRMFPSRKMLQDADKLRVPPDTP